MYSLRLFGGLALEGPSGPLRGGVAQRRRLALLATLGAAGERGVSRDKLAGYLWPESDETGARHLLSDSVYVLRKALGEEAILAVGEFLRLNQEVVWCDAVAFEAAIRGEKSEEAVGIYAGPFVDGFYLNTAGEWDQWVETERRRLADAYAKALESLAEAAESASEHNGAAEWWKRLAAHDPYNSRVVLRLMQALTAAGDPANALEYAQLHELRVREELGIEPPEDLRAYVERLRAEPVRVPNVSSEVTHTGVARGATPESVPVTLPTDRNAEPRTVSLRRVLTTYAVVSLAVLVAVHIFTPQLGLPDWFFPAAVFVLVAGLPIIVGAARVRGDISTGLGAVVLAVMILVLVAGAVVVPRLMAPDARSPSASTDGISNTRVAVFPFQVRGSPEAAYLGEGVMDLLSEAVDGLGELRRVDPFALMGRIRRQDVGPLDPDKARELARHFGAGRFVLGNVVELGDDIRLSASLYDLTRGGVEPAADASAQGGPEKLPVLVRQLTRGLLAEVPLGSGDWLEGIATVEAANWTALRAYLEGEALMRRGEFREASPAFIAALEADSTFALAWYRLSMAQTWGSGTGDEVKSIDMAMRYRERLSARDRLLVQTADAWVHGQGERAERLAQVVVGNYPDHTEGWYWLGESRYWYQWQVGWPLAHAEEAFRRALALDPSFPQASYHAASIARYERRWAEAEELLQHGPVDLPGWVLNIRAGLVFGSGDREAQRNVMRELETAPDGRWLVVGYGLAVVDSLGAAQRVFKGLFERAERRDLFRASAQVHLAQLEVARGRWSQARVELARAAELRPAVAFAIGAWLAAMPFLQRPEAELAALRDSLRDWQPPDLGAWGRVNGAPIPDELRPWFKHYALGLLSARLQDTESAQRWARELEEAAEPPDSAGLRRDLALEIRALAAHGAGRPAEALALLEESSMAVTYWSAAWPPLYRRPSSVFLRAELLQQLDRGEEALAWYDSFFWSWSYVFLSPACLGMAEIYESRGERDKAVEYYRRFVARWQDADPEYQPLVADVQARIARLTGERHAEPNPDAGSR